MRISAKYRPMKRLVAGSLLLAAVLGASVPARAAGGMYGSGSITSGCAGGAIAVTAINTNGLNWVFHVDVLCSNATPSSLTVAGSWNPDLGGPVSGFSTGGLLIGKTPCGTTSNVLVQTSMVLAPLVSGKVTLTRSCF